MNTIPLSLLGNVSLPATDDAQPSPTVDSTPSTPTAATGFGNDSSFSPASFLGDVLNQAGALASNLDIPAVITDAALAARVMAMGPRLQATNLKPAEQAELMSHLGTLSGADLSAQLDKLDAALGQGTVADQTHALRNVVRQQRMDGFMDRYNASYMLADGSTVRAQPHFRMTGGYNGTPQDDLNSIQSALQANGTWNGSMAAAAGKCVYGRGSPEQVKKVTQALIDAGQLDAVKQANPGMSDSDAIRMMQWKFGVGIDCAGFVQQALYAVDGGNNTTYGLQSIGNESLSNLKNNPAFKKVSPADAQPGDIIALDPPAGDTVGHRVIVEDAHTISASEAAGFTDPSGFLQRGDTVHSITVDSSWGAGSNGDLSGGVQQRTWLFDENNGKWAEVQPDGSLKPDAVGPYEHPLDGVYRARNAQ